MALDGAMLDGEIETGADGGLFRAKRNCRLRLE
jgi:hypothetical protein